MVEKDEKIMFGSILKEARIRQGYTREQIAERAEIGTRYLIAIEHDEKKPRFDVLFRLIRSLGISADQIFYPERKDQDEQEHVRIQRLYQCLSKRDQRLLFAVADSMIDMPDEE